MTLPPIEQLHAEYQTMIRSIISRRVPAADVDDVEQDTWIRVMEHIQAKTDVQNVRTWIGDVARTAIQYHRRRQQEPTISLDDPIGHDEDGNNMTLADTIPDTSEPSLNPAIADAMRDAVERLPQRTAEVMTMHYYDDKQIDEIAIMLGISAGTVKWHLATGRDLLRRHLDPLSREENIA